jgi:signal transduction histidine kinase
MSSLTAMPAYHKIPGETEAAAAPRRKRGGRRLPGGLLIIGAASLILALATAQECHSVTHFPSLLYGLVLWGWWGVVAGTLWQLGPKMPSLLRLSPLRIALHLMAGCVVAAAHLVMLGSLSLFIPEWRVNAPVLAVLTGLLHVNRFGMEILIYGFIFGLTGIVQFQVKAQRDAMRSLELQRQLAAAHLKALQMQMEPHFLFNTLNAITTLVELGRQAQAAQMLGHLNAILKRTLERNAPEKVPLSQELEVVENYLAIEQVRFADRLRVDIKVDPGALQSLVPCFLLQPIVENAIRHGIAHCEDEGFVEASAKREGNRLRISVRDTGAGIKGRATPGSGIGLTNTRERLAYFYPDAYEMEAGPIKAGGFEVAIELPYERAG